MTTQDTFNQHVSPGLGNFFAAVDTETNALRTEVATLTAKIAELTKEPEVPAVVVGGPVSVNATVTANNATKALNTFNAFRDTNHLTVYTPSPTQRVVPTNRYGIDVVVVDAKIVAIYDRQVSGAVAPAIPDNGWVLSGHGTARDWLLVNARVGGSVTWAEKVPDAPVPDPIPVPTTGNSPRPYPEDARAVYFMMWTNSGSPRLSSLPAGINVLNLSFLQGDPMRLVGPASEGSDANFDTEIKKVRARGVNIVLSIGGAHGGVNIANRDSVVNQVMAINNNRFPVDGIDWDIEGSVPMAASDVVYISKRLRELRGPNFAITLAPNGSNIANYIAVGKELNAAGVLTTLGQQFYDAVVSIPAMMGRIDQAVAAGIKPSQYLIGMMVGSADTYWTIQECEAAINAALSKYPDLRGGYLWEAGRPGTLEWVNLMVRKFPS